MQICDVCMSPSKGHGDIRRVEVVTAGPDAERPIELPSGNETFGSLSTVTAAAEFCETCRGLLEAQDWSGLSAAKRVTTVKRARRTPEAQA